MEEEERDRGSGKEGSAGAGEKREDLPVRDHQAGDGRRRERQHGRVHEKERQRDRSEKSESDAHAMLRLQVQMVEAPAPLEDQTGPGDGSVPQVGAEEGGEGPSLQVRAAKLLVEEDPQTGVPKPVPELDVLDCPRVASRIEPAGGFERGAADGAAARPERRRFGISLLVHEMVEKVPELRNQPRSARRGVVRAEHRGDFGPVLQEPGDPPDRVRRRDDVRIDEQENVSGRVARSEVARGSRTGVAFQAEEPDGETRHDRGGVVGRAVVDDEDLDGRSGGGSQGAQALFEPGGIVVHRNDN